MGAVQTSVGRCSEKLNICYSSDCRGLGFRTDIGRLDRQTRLDDFYSLYIGRWRQHLSVNAILSNCPDRSIKSTVEKKRRSLKPEYAKETELRKGEAEYE